MLCSKIKIQQIALGVKGLLLQAVFLPKIFCFQNSRLLSTVQSPRLLDSKWLGMAKALVGVLYENKLLYSLKGAYCSKQVLQTIAL